MRACALLAFASFAVSGAGAASCGARRVQTGQQANRAGNGNAVAAQPTPQRGAEGNVGGEIKVLAEGYYSGVNDAFVAVAHDATTYAALSELFGRTPKDLPELSGDFFEHNVVVAAFLGARPTGGYVVQIERGDKGSLRIRQQTPRKGFMQTQALTTAFKMVAVPTDKDGFTSENELRLDLDGAWQAAMRPYRVTAGEFKMTGGFAAHSETFGIAGDLRVMRLGALATLFFNLKSNGSAKARTLDAAATAVVKGSSLTIAYLDAGTLVDLPRSGLNAKGDFNAGEEKLSLTFDSLPSNIADGYEGRGKLEATATAPAPPKNRLAGEP